MNNSNDEHYEHSANSANETAERDDNAVSPQSAPELIRVEVAYAKPEKQLILTLQVAPGTTMLQAAERSEICSHFPEIDLNTVSMGVFGKLEKQPAKRVLKAGDRVEIYRPLLIDPKEARKNRAKTAETHSKRKTIDDADF